jgi:hypothetical protein
MTVKDASTDSESVYPLPAAVLSDSSLTHAQKIGVLKRWKANLVDRLRATGEGMTPPAGQTAREAAMIEPLTKALAVLEAAADDEAVNGSRR